MKSSFIFYLAILPGMLFGQTIKSILIDRDSKLPVSDAFIFFANTSTGTASFPDGTFELPCLDRSPQLMMISHLNYQIENLELKINQLIPDTIFLIPNSLELSEVIVEIKANPRLRRQREQAFLRSFIGSDRSKIEIENLNILLFEESDDTLLCQSDQALLINNNLLGYQVVYFLDEFKLHPNDDVQFQGKAFFKAMEADGKKLAQYRKNRLRAYQNSPQYFFSKLVSGQLDTLRYQIGYSRRKADRTFELYRRFSFSQITKDTLQHRYIIPCSDFFTVVNKNVRLSSKIHKPKLVADSYGEVKPIPIEYETSYLRSHSGKIMLNNKGVVINPKDIEEFGYWATVRTSELLPSDFTSPKR